MTLGLHKRQRQCAADVEYPAVLVVSSGEFMLEYQDLRKRFDKVDECARTSTNSAAFFFPQFVAHLDSAQCCAFLKCATTIGRFKLKRGGRVATIMHVSTTWINHVQEGSSASLL